jgi:serine kinase of HPr protein (carbohydrate metabolism regulator)
MSGPATVHASAVAVAGTGVLIRGGSGSGKSSLALALLAADPAGTRLIADDRVILSAAGGRLLAAPPEPLAGLIEVRWVGILPVPYLADVPLRLVVDLVPPAEAVRLPEPEQRQAVIAGVPLARIALPAGLADAALRVRAALCALQ